jgi:hypothetical protein
MNEDNLKYLKENGYIYCDYTKKIKNLIDYQQFLLKIKNSKYNKCVFILDCKTLVKDVKYLLLKINDLYSDDYIIIFNKDNYQYINNKCQYSNTILQLFLNLTSNLYKCGICLEEYKRILNCHNCSFEYCDNCRFQLYKKNNDELKCPICKIDLLL